MDEFVLESLQNSNLIDDYFPIVDQAAKSLGSVDPGQLIALLANDSRRFPTQYLPSIDIVAFIRSLGYRIVSPIGKGGGGYVFLVTKESGDDLFALKVLRHDNIDIADFENRVARFLREVETLKKIKDIAVPRICSSVTDSRYPLYVMEYIRGENLKQLVDRRGPLEVTIALELVLRAALVIDELDMRKVVHRDIKPDNLILDDTGRLWVVDFGLARKEGASFSRLQTGKDAYMGTTFFIAPEQSDNPTTVDSRADVYSLGCTLFYLLQGVCHEHTEDAKKQAIFRLPELSWKSWGKTKGKREKSHYLLEEMLTPSREKRIQPKDLVSRLKSLLSIEQRRRPTLLNDCVGNLRRIESVQSEGSLPYDEVDSQRLLLLFETETVPARRNELAICASFIDRLFRSGRISPVQKAALRLLAHRRAVVSHTQSNEPALVLRYQFPESEDCRILVVMSNSEEGNDGQKTENFKYFRTIKNLNHPSIATLIEIGHECGTFFADMHYPAGKDVFTYRREGGTLAWSVVAPVFGAVVSAVAALHGVGIAHGNIQPANIVVSTLQSASGTVNVSGAVLIGFGHKPNALPREDLRGLGRLLLFLISGRETASDELNSEAIKEQFGSNTRILADWLADLLNYLLFDQVATAELAAVMWSSLDERVASAWPDLDFPPVAPPGQVAADHLRFHAVLSELGGIPETVSRETVPGSTDIVPHFLLFRRVDRVVLAIVPEHASVNAFGLQKTTEPKCEAKLISEDEVVSLGFTPGDVHSAFLDPHNNIAHIIVDATILTHAIFHPDVPVIVPGNSAGKSVRIRTTLAAWLNAMFRLHGTRKVFFGNISRDSWPDQKLLNHLDNQPVRTRFAPTPSGGLHLGNARTALVSYLVALRSGLRHAPESPTQFFHLRFDDTDLDRCEPGAEEQIKDELKWLGLNWNQEFSQMQRHSEGKYLPIERALRAVGLLAQNQFHVSNLNIDVEAEHDYGGYYNIIFDLKRGPQIFHSPPNNRKQAPKAVELTRSDGIPFYRFAGCVDDITLTTVAFRDSGQMGLSVVQSHIRHGFERLRQMLHNSRSASQRLSRLSRDFHAALELNEEVSSIPLVVYAHLPILVDQNGGKLSKRNLSVGKAEPLEAGSGAFVFTMRSFRGDGICSEAVLAYLLTTILPPQQGVALKDHLRRIVRTFALVGRDAALMMIAPEINLLELVRSTKAIRCHPRWIRRANRWFIDALPAWRYRRLFHNSVTKPMNEKQFPHADLSVATQLRIYKKRADFADLRQISDVILGTDQLFLPVSPQTEEVIRTACAEKYSLQHGSALVVERLQQEIKALRERGRAVDGLLADLRRLLTGADSSPAVETILSVLDPSIVEARIKNCGGTQVTMRQVE